MPNRQLVQAYRTMFRAALRAVQFSKPSRYVVRDQMRLGFRDPHGTFDPERIATTIQFFESIQRGGTLERLILNNLCHVHWERDRRERGPSWKRISDAKPKGTEKKKKSEVIASKKYDHYDMTVKMLNDTMNLCLR